MAVDTAKIVLLGDTAVGKTCLVRRIVEGTFDAEVGATIGVAFSTRLVEREDGSCVKFQIWDTAGQESFHTLSSLYYRAAQAALVVFDVTREKTFAGVRTWVHEVSRLGPEGLVVVIIGNKTDLAQRRTVTTEAAREFAESRGALYFEVSARTNDNVEAVFETVSQSLFSRGALKLKHERAACSASEVDPVIRLDADTEAAARRRAARCCR